MNRFVTALAFLLLGSTSTSLLAQANSMDSERAAVLATVDAFFDALQRGDRRGLEETTLADAEFVISATDGDGQISRSTRSREEFVSSLTNSSANMLERYWDALVMIREGIAIFWAPYDFHVDGSFSHCGIDSFQLFKEDGRWKIGNSSYTVQRLSCDPSPLGPI